MNPLDVDPLDGKPLVVDPLWARGPMGKIGQYASSCERTRMDNLGGMMSHPVMDNLAEEEEQFVRLLPGMILVEAPLRIPLPELFLKDLDDDLEPLIELEPVPYQVRVSAPSRRHAEARDRFTVEWAFTSGYVLDPETGRVNSLPPRKLDVYMDYLTYETKDSETSGQS